MSTVEEFELDGISNEHNQSKQVGFRTPYKLEDDRMTLRPKICMLAFAWACFAIAPAIADAQNAQTHRFEHSSSWKKPSSESHRWSYERACNNCLAQVERRHGVDWKVTDVEFEDKGRTTKTETDRWGKRTWRCTHTVVAKYNIVRRGAEKKLEDAIGQEFISRKLHLTYKMINPLFNGQKPTDKADAVSAESQTHRFEHSSSWKKPSSESHRWSYERACNNCLAQVERRHGVDWKVTDVEFEDKGRTTKTETDRWGKRTWRCTHTVVAKYNIVRRGGSKNLEDATDQKMISRELNITYKMMNPLYEVNSKK